MKDEIIPCRVVVSPEDNSVGLVPVRELKLRPGDSAMFTMDPPRVVVYRAWFGRRWNVAARAHIRGLRGPNLTVEELDQE